MAQYLDYAGLKLYNTSLNTKISNTYYTKTSGNANRADIDAILNGDKALVTPVISTNTWTVKTSDGSSNIGGTYSGTSITVPTGAKVTYIGKWKWTHDDDKKDPETVSGTWGSTKPATGVESSACSEQALTTNNAGDLTIATVTISAEKKGLMLNGQKVVKASGSDSATATAKVLFRDNVYYGPVTTTDVTSSILNTSPVSTSLLNTKVSTVTATTTSSQYFCYAYPKSYGVLSTIIADGADPILGNFNSPLTISVTNKAGLAKDYYVYISTNRGAFSNNSLAFK